MCAWYKPYVTFTKADPDHLKRAVAELGRRRPVVVSRAIYNTQGIKVIEAGLAVDERVYERLMQHQLSAPLEESVGTEPSVTGAVLRQLATELIARQPIFARMTAQAPLRDRLLRAIENVPLPRAVAFQLTLMHELQPDLFRRAVAGALVATWLGEPDTATLQDLAQLAAAAVLRDLGMLHIDPVLLQPPAPLTAEHRRQLYAHPLLSAMVLERHLDFSRPAIRAVLEHHEALDGSGYPRHLTGEAVSPWGRALGAAELLAAQHALPAHRLETRLSMQLRVGQRRLDPAFIRRLQALIPRVAAMSEALLSLADAAERLRSLQRLLRSWPDDVVGTAAGLSAARRQAVADIDAHCRELERTLADAGVAEPQLAMLAQDEGDPGLALEMSMLAEEAAWHLRGIGRMARRRWRLAPGEAFPAALQAWLDQTEAALARLHGG